jgi:hypothetical protein
MQNSLFINYGRKSYESIGPKEQVEIKVKNKKVKESNII